MYFQSTKLTNILIFILARDSFVRLHNRSQLNTPVPLSVFTIESVTHLGNYLISDCKVSETIASKTGSLYVHVFGLQPVCAINLSRDESSDKLINFLDSQLETRNYRGSRL